MASLYRLVTTMNPVCYEPVLKSFCYLVNLTTSHRPAVRQQTDHAGVSTNSGFSLVIGPEYWLLIGPSYQTKITYIIRRQSGLCSARYICLYFSQGNLVIIVPRNWFHCCSLINSDQINILSLRIYNCNPTTIKFTLHKHS